MRVQRKTVFHEAHRFDRNHQQLVRISRVNVPTLEIKETNKADAFIACSLGKNDTHLRRLIHSVGKYPICTFCRLRFCHEIEFTQNL